MGQVSSCTPSSPWAMDGFQGLKSLNFYPSLGALGTCWFSQVLCLWMDDGPSPCLPLTNLGNLGCSPESLVICHCTFLVCLP